MHSDTVGIEPTEPTIHLPPLESLLPPPAALDSIRNMPFLALLFALLFYYSTHPYDFLSPAMRAAC